MACSASASHSLLSTSAGTRNVSVFETASITPPFVWASMRAAISRSRLARISAFIFFDAAFDAETGGEFVIDGGIGGFGDFEDFDFEFDFGAVQILDAVVGRGT